MKNFSILKIAIFLVLSITVSSIQAQNYEKVEQELAKGYELAIPDSYKLNISQKEKNELITIRTYDEKLEGYVYITAGTNKEREIKIASIMTPKRMQVQAGGCDDGYRDCARGCNDKPHELGTILCIGYCIIDCSGL